MICGEDRSGFRRRAPFDAISVAAAAAHSAGAARAVDRSRHSGDSGGDATSRSSGWFANENGELITRDASSAGLCRWSAAKGG